MAHQQHDPLNTLALSAHATVVRINYRLSQKEPYPKPIHDILASYDWILKHLLPATRNDDSPYKSDLLKLGVCGELIGGSLASMLALTECHVHRPGISATALGNPIVDWNSPFELPVFDDTNELDKQLIALRKKSFTNAETRYDPFASPLLFFRTPAFELPVPAYHSGFSSPPPATSNPESPAERDPSLSAPTPQRRFHRKYPPPGSGLRIPTTRIDVGLMNPLREQGMEIARLMQRSVDIYEHEEGGYHGASDEAQRRVRVVERAGKGLWGEGEMVEVGAWFGEVLRGRG